MPLELSVSPQNRTLLPPKALTKRDGLSLGAEDANRRQESKPPKYLIAGRVALDLDQGALSARASTKSFHLAMGRHLAMVSYSDGFHIRGCCRHLYRPKPA